MSTALLVSGSHSAVHTRGHFCSPFQVASSPLHPTTSVGLAPESVVLQHQRMMPAALAAVESFVPRCPVLQEPDLLSEGTWSCPRSS